MAENQVTIVVTKRGDADAIAALTQIKSQVDALNKTKLSIKLDTGGFNTLDKELRETIAVMAQYRTATAELTVANNQLAHDELQLKIAIEATKVARAKAREEKQKTARADQELAQAQEATIQSENKAKTAAENRAAAESRATAATENRKAAESRATAATEKRKEAEAKATAATERRKQKEVALEMQEKRLQAATENTTTATDQLINRFISMGRMMVFNTIRKGLTDALSLLKDVDDELVVVRKVSQATAQEMAVIEKNAYGNASKYGVSASDYLSSVAEFTRAGYREQADALAELSTKAQIVGDTTGDVANQFLLAVDKAYQYNGAITDLSAVLDGANEIDNKYATSIEKIASGMGIVAPVAAQMHVGVDELAAAIGTITAVTQRTGTEAARALRAIFLNIVGDTKTEIDEGVTWTTGEIAGLRDVIRQYAPEAYKAAQATGSIIDPMEAIAGLSKSMKEGLLTEQELMDMISDIGGKLRSSQLLAIVQNWDMYQSMLGDYAGAVGSADREVENALDSWTRKSEILRNTWAQVVSATLDTKAIKGLLDLANGMLKLGGSLSTITGLIGGLVFAFRGLDIVTSVAKKFEELNSASEGLKANFTSMPGYIGLAVAAISAIIIGIRAYNQHQEKLRKQHLESAQTAIKHANGIDKLKEEYMEITTAEMTEGERAVELMNFHAKLREEYGLETITLSDLNNERQKAIDLMELESSGDVLDAWRKAEDDYDAIQSKIQNWANESFVLSDDNISWDDFYGKRTNLLGELVSTNQASELYNHIAALKEFGVVINDLGEGMAQIKLDGSQFESAADKITKLNFAIEYLKDVDETKLFGNEAQIYYGLMDTLNGMLEQGNGLVAKYEEDIKAYAETEANYLFLKNKEIAANVEDADSLMALRTSMMNASSGYDETITAIDALLNKKYQDITATEEWATKLIEAENEITKHGRYSADEFIGSPSEINKQTDALFGYSDALNGAAAAIQEFNDATAKGEKGDALKSYANVYGKFMEHYEAGEYGSNEYQAAVKTFLPEEVLKGLDYDYEEAGKMLASKFWQGVFAENGEDHGVNFADILHEQAGDTGELTNELGEVVAKFTELGDGVYNIAVDDFGTLADYLGVNEDVIIAMFDAMGIWSSELINMDGALLKLAQDTGALSETADGLNQVNIDTFVSKLVEAGRTDEDIWRIVSAMSEMDNVQFYNLNGTIDDVTSSLDETIQKARDSETATKDLGDTTATPKVDLDTTNFYRKVDLIRATLANLSSTTTKIGMTSNAGGTDSAPGGISLVNEEGPELIQEGDRARIAGGGAPTITYLEPGARVFTAEETAHILKGNAVSGEIGAYSSGLGGSANIRSRHGSSAKTKANTTVAKKSGASNSSAKSSAGTKDQTDAQKEQLDIHKAKVSLLESELDLLEAQNKPVNEQVAKIYEIQNALIDQINYMKSIGAEQEDINKLYVEWYKWQDQIAKLQEKIYDDLDDAIKNELDEIKAMYDEQAKAIDDQIDALKEARDVQADELELEEKRLAVEEARAKLESAQAERTVRMYNASTGQWEWVANAKNVQSAQEALNSAEEALAEYLEDMEYQAQVDALEAQKKHIEDEYDEIEAQWKEILDALEEPAKELGEVLADIAKNATADQREEIELLNGMLAKFGYAVPGYGRKYDNGGLLYGLGGIKATSAAEGVLSPELTAAMLSPQSNKVFSQRMAELGYLYGANKGIPSTMLSGGGRIGSQSIQNGNIYQYGNITLSEAQAKTTTVYELAQLSRNLSAYNRVN